MGKSLLIVFHFLIEDLASVIARVELLNSEQYVSTWASYGRKSWTQNEVDKFAKKKKFFIASTIN